MDTQDTHVRLYLALMGLPTLDALRAQDLEEQRRRDAAKPVDRPLPANIHRDLLEAVSGDIADALPAGTHQRLVKALVG